MLEMVWLHVGDERCGAREFEERAVALVGFNNHESAVIPRRSRPDLIEVTANDERGRQSRLNEDEHQH